MKNVTFKFNVATAYGVTLPTPVAVQGEFEELESYSEISAKELPDNDDILNYVNAKRKASARASATNDALQKAGIAKPNLKDSEDLQVATMAKVFIARGDSEDVAKSKARAALGL